MSDVFGCPFTKLEEPCKADICAFALRGPDGSYKCAVARLAESGGWAAHVIPSVEQLRARRGE